MNLHAAVSSAVGAVNPQVIGTVRVSTGYTTAPDGSPLPSYRDVPNVPLQIQAISGGSGSDGPMLQHLDSLGIQGTLRAFWIGMNVEAVDRVAGKGGDLIMVPATLLFPAGTYLVVQMVESWDQAGWTHVIGQLQNG